MGLLQIFLDADLAADIMRRPRLAGADPGLQAGEFLFRHAHHVVVLDRAGGDQGHAVRRDNCARHIVAQVVAREGGDRLLVAQDRPAHRLVRIDHGLQMIEDDVVGRVARLPDLLQHDLALALQFALLEGRAR